MKYDKELECECVNLRTCIERNGTGRQPECVCVNLGTCIGRNGMGRQGTRVCVRELENVYRKEGMGWGGVGQIPIPQPRKSAICWRLVPTRLFAGAGNPKAPATA